MNSPTLQLAIFVLLQHLAVPLQLFSKPCEMKMLINYVPTSVGLGEFLKFTLQEIHANLYFHVPKTENMTP